ncbi:KRAB-A domain-containing protein 2 [Trichinella sp. T9]|nr:KRAB-A domain-containing protein 2 [Trichinella sp. T9]
MPNVSSLICQHYNVHKEVAKQLSLFLQSLQVEIEIDALSMMLIKRLVVNKSANVTQEACHLFLTFCEECHKKRARKLPKSPVVKPLVSTNLMSRAQVDLINFQTMPDGDFKYIMTYLNHFMEFCILSPLMLKQAEEVASKLLKIFLTFGAPSILQSDNGQEFSYVIIAELKTCWPELKLVTGRPRHPQSQANDEDSLNRDGKNYDENESSIMKHLPETFIKARKEAALGQTRAAAKMTRRTKKMLIPLQIGQNYTLRVPDVDRGPADPKNFLVVVMAECEGLYTVGCREGKLASKFTAADLQVISENILSIDEVPDTEIPLRTAVTKATGGQGYVKCMCLSGCSSGRCSCSRKRVLCNSRCHPGKSCNNI